MILQWLQNSRKDSIENNVHREVVYLSEKILVIIEHRPTPKQRPAWSRGRAYTPKKTRDYEALLADVAQATMLSNKKKRFGSETPLKVTATFVFKPSKSWSKKRRQEALDGLTFPILSNTGDVDNLLKSCLDSFNGIVFDDDKAIVEIVSKKRYGEKDQIMVLVEEV